MAVVILIDYSCNYTSRDSNGPMSGVIILHPPSSDFGAPKGTHTPMTAGKCGVSDPVQQLRKGVHQITGRTFDHCLKNTEGP